MTSASTFALHTHSHSEDVLASMTDMEYRSITRELQREQAAADEASKGPIVTKDYSLKQGEKIKIKINSTRKTRDTDETNDDAFGTSSSSGKASSSSGNADLLGFSSAPYVLPAYVFPRSDLGVNGIVTYSARLGCLYAGML